MDTANTNTDRIALEALAQLNREITEDEPCSGARIEEADGLSIIKSAIEKATQRLPYPARIGTLEEMAGDRDRERLDWLERNHAYVGRNGYRGRNGLVIYIADPGGHYMEERTREIGQGLTVREAIDDAMNRKP